jgi:malate dehydrogenase (oxaloacetate-decarboxylating)(NADP+)
LGREGASFMAGNSWRKYSPHGVKTDTQFRAWVLASPGITLRWLAAGALLQCPSPRMRRPSHNEPRDKTMSNADDKRAELRRAALEYHEFPTPGKIAIAATKQLVNQRDLALAYSPGVAAACEEIVADPANAFRYTSRGNLVAVITNGTAVLGLGDIGPLAAKPVMEGKGVLFKKFAGIDVFDIEISENNLDKLIDHIAALEPTFGGINLEDIKAPDCFYVERALRARMKIPVFHDDQHGTAIVVGAAMLNALKVSGKDIKKVKLVASGAGAAALACLGLLLKLGLPRENVWVTDLAGVVYEGRKELMDEDKIQFAQKTSLRTLAEVIAGADIFLGLSAGGVLKPEMVAKMAPSPLIFALANPNPEILPEDVNAVRSDAIIATGRTDYPNQVNNVLCFPYIFRGALDSGATTITDEMEIAAVRAIAELAQAEQSEVVAAAYGGANLSFGPEYVIPKPFDPRLMMKIAPAVAKAAADSGVALRPVRDLDAYREKLQTFVYASGQTMKPIFTLAKRAANKRVAYAEGEEERVLRAVQVVVDEGLARPTLIGRPEVIAQRVEKFGLRLQAGRDYDLVNTENDHRYRNYWQTYHELTARKGVTAQLAKIEMRRRLTLIGSMLLRTGEVDGMLCGTWGTTAMHLPYIDQVIGLREGVKTYACMNGLILPGRQVMLVDTHVNYDPSAEQLAEITVMAAEEMMRFGLRPKAALLSHSNFGSSNQPSAVKMRSALGLLQQQAPWLEVDGEMHGDAALDAGYRGELMPKTTLTGEANLLVLPNIDAANISYNLLKTAAGGGIAIGPVLLGAAKPVHILTPSATVRRIVNMTALTVADANAAR